MSPVLLNRIRALEDQVRILKTRQGEYSRSVKILTISTGIITADYHNHFMLQPQSGISDDLDTINGVSDGRRITLYPQDSGDTITVKNNTGNILLGADRVLDSQSDTIELIYSETLGKWLELAFHDTSGLNANFLDGLDSTAFFILAGQTGGQTGSGGIGSGENLILKSTGHATKGKIIFGNAGTTAYDEVNERWGVGTASPSFDLDVSKSAAVVALRVKSSSNIAQLLLERPDSAGSSTIAFRDTDFGDQWLIGTGVSADGDNFEFTNGAGAVKATLDTSGNLIPVGYLSLTHAADASGNIRFSEANPYIVASSYILIPGGAFFNSGTVYTTAQLQARGGIHNDAAAYLQIDGGTSGYTYFPNSTGFGLTTPQGKIHGHDGTGGFLFVTKTAVAGTAVEIIPNGTGDVTGRMFALYTVVGSGGAVNQGSGGWAISGDNDILNDGTNIVKLRVNADGSVDVRRTGGTQTYTISLWLIWT